MTTEQKQLEPYTGEFAILGPEAEEFLDILEENTGSRQINASSLPVWRFPGSGGEEWVFEDETGGRQRTQTLRGVVLAQRGERVFFRDAYGGGGAPPDCRSNDGVVGMPATDDDGQPINMFYTPNGEEVVYGGNCASCPLAQWESKRLVDPSYNGSGQACSEYRFMVVQRPDEPTPEGVRLPPSALRSWQAFGEQVARARTRLSTLVIDLSLFLPKGKTTAELVVEPVAYISKETAAELRAIAPDVKRPQLAERTETPVLSAEQEQAVDGALPY